jgi:hypothetical protein
MEAFANVPRELDPPLAPFHWPVEFPEVFDRDNPGFDVVIGNPPFAGKNTIGESTPAGYLDWLKALHHGAHGNADLVAHFFRRAFTLLRNRGCFGLIATNTVRQGDTRETGLRSILAAGGTIIAARQRLTWPGAAAVVVSVVHVIKAPGPRSRCWTASQWSGSAHSWWKATKMPLRRRFVRMPESHSRAASCWGWGSPLTMKRTSPRPTGWQRRSG